MKFVAALFLLLIACRDGRLRQVSDCGKPCYGGAEAVAGVGACTRGLWSCDDEGNMTCVGWVPPMAEDCNGIDDNCDGLVDVAITNNPKFCSNECGAGLQQCISGRWTECSARKPQPEICDGIDNDCDGRSDEPEDMPVKYCYTGPGMSAAFGICHPGSERCIGGSVICLGEQTPLPEVCDGIDNDCDGPVDEGSSATDTIDLVIVFDNSGSMAGVAAALKAATAQWVGRYSTHVDRRYALVTAPDNDPTVYVPVLFRDFTDAAGLATAVNAQTGLTGSGSEPTLDALDRLTDSTNPLHLSWRPGAKRVVVVFSDEEPQSYSGGCGGWCQSSANTVTSRLVMGGTVVHVFTSRADTNAWQKWLTIATAGGGSNWDITDSIVDLETSLDSVIKTATCGP